MVYSALPTENARDTHKEDSDFFFESRMQESRADPRPREESAVLFFVRFAAERYPQPESARRCSPLHFPDYLPCHAKLRFSLPFPA